LIPDFFQPVELSCQLSDFCIKLLHNYYKHFLFFTFSANAFKKVGEAIYGLFPLFQLVGVNLILWSYLRYGFLFH